MKPWWIFVWSSFQPQHQYSIRGSPGVVACVVRNVEEQFYLASTSSNPIAQTSATEGGMIPDTCLQHHVYSLS